jgi:hypothetical protein
MQHRNSIRQSGRRKDMGRSKGRICVGSLLYALSIVPYSFAADTGDELMQLRRQIAEQRQHMEAMEQRLLELEGKEKARASTGVEAGYLRPSLSEGLETQEMYDGGFYVKSKDGSFSLRVNGFGQLRYTFFSPETGKDNNNFDLALGRLAVSGNAFTPKFSYFMQFEGSTFGNNNNITMLDWWGRYSFSPELYVQTGRSLIFYDRQFITHPGMLLFSDLSEAEYAFGLYRAIGALVGGKMGPLSYTAQVTNSIRALDAGGQQNFGQETASVGRLELDILEPYGYIESLPVPPSSPQLSIGLAGAFNPIDSASQFQNLLPGDRTSNVTLDGGFRWRALSLQAAGYFRHNNRRGASASDDWGYYGQVGYYIVPEHWELAARISGVDFQRANNPATIYQRTTEYSIGLNYYLYGHGLKVQMDYSFLDSEPFTGTHQGNNRLRVQTQFLF